MEGLRAWFEKHVHRHLCPWCWWVLLNQALIDYRIGRNTRRAVPGFKMARFSMVMVWSEEHGVTGAIMGGGGLEFHQAKWLFLKNAPEFHAQLDMLCAKLQEATAPLAEQSNRRGA